MAQDVAEFALGAFIKRWYPSTRHDLAASESESWSVPDLLGLAAPEDLARWNTMELGYGDPRGARWLRTRIGELYEGIDRHGVVCFAGAQEALNLVLRAVVGPGDHAILVLPVYQPSELTLTALCDTTAVCLDPDRGWELDLSTLTAAIRPNTRMVLVNFPNNPTGKLPRPEAFTALIALCRRHGLWLINDEVYRHIDRDGSVRLPSVADAYERGISIDALSKGFGLPGLRIGWMACRDPELLRRVREVKQIASLFTAAPSEVLAHIAIGARAKILARNRSIADVNLSCLQGFIARHADRLDWHVPEGGVVGFLRYLGDDGVEAFAARMAEEAGVLVLPSSVWQSALAQMAPDRFRIGFGRRSCVHGIAAMDEVLSRGRKRSAA